MYIIDLRTGPNGRIVAQDVSSGARKAVPSSPSLSQQQQTSTPINSYATPQVLLNSVDNVNGIFQDFVVNESYRQIADRMVRY